MRAFSLLALAATFAFGGCYVGEAPQPPEVGPAPLRRLTNSEYLNALHDLFPGVSPVLPPLPSDAVLGGFDNDVEAQAPSDVLIARYENIANLYAAAVTADDASVHALVGCDASTPTQAGTCATQFITQAGRRIFRRPLTSDEISRFQLKFTSWQATLDFAGAVRLTLSTMLQSPQFIYRPEPLSNEAAGSGEIAPVEPYALATRMSFLIWASAPDDALLDAAENGQLATEEGVRAQAERMLSDDRARRTLWNFHRQWLGLDLVLTDEQAVRAPDVDPNWTSRTPISAEMESELFVENTLMNGGTLHDLLTSPRAWVDGEMARIYKLPAPADPSVFTPVDLPASERAGVLTRIAFLAGTSHPGGTSPPIRGNAVQLRLFCELPLSPPPGADLSMPKASPDDGPQTTRMLFETRTAPAVCQSCHASLNGIGFGFEHYDAAGAFRAIENGLPVDSTGTLLNTDVNGAFDGALALSNTLDRSAQVHRCATKQWLRYALGRAPSDVELPLLDGWTSAFVANRGDVRSLLIDIVTSPTFRFRKVGSP